MKIGTFMMPLHPPEKDRTQTFEEDVECVIWADELGFPKLGLGSTIPQGGNRFPPTMSSSPTCGRRRKIFA